jgi:hypothetical protein
MGDNRCRIRRPGLAKAIEHGDPATYSHQETQEGEVGRGGTEKVLFTPRFI